VTTAEGPRYSHQQGIRGIVYGRGAPAIQIIVVPTGVTILLWLCKPPRSWTGMVGPSLRGFTIAPLCGFLSVL
jgi:hypothetical protein